MHQEPTFGVIVPTLNPGPAFSAWLDGLKRQSRQPDYALVLDSQSSDGTPERAAEAGLKVVEVPREHFDHGGTRQLCASYLQRADVLVYLTQDAVLNDPYALENIIACFSDPRVGSALGRHVPGRDATALAAFHRRYNYPARSYAVTQARLPKMGIRGIFCSNSFAAYRTSALREVGGFPARLIMG